MGRKKARTRRAHPRCQFALHIAGDHLQALHPAAQLRSPQRGVEPTTRGPDAAHGLHPSSQRGLTQRSLVFRIVSYRLQYDINF